MNKILLLSSFMLIGLRPISAQESRSVVKFGMVTDVHYADIPDNGQKIYSKSLEKLQECVDTMNRNKVDFLVELGDFKDIDKPLSDAKSLIYLFRAETVFSKFLGAKYHVLGNHDVDCISKKQFLSTAKNTGIPETSSYYSFDKKGIHFIVLDADFDSTGKEYDRGKFKWDDPNIPPLEVKWLKKDLHKAKGTTIIFCHQPLDGEDGYYVKNAATIRKIFEKSGKVAAVFQGHFHEGQYHFMNGIHYYTLKALVEGSGAENNSYAIVEITTENIRVQGFRKAISMQFNGRVKK